MRIVTALEQLRATHTPALELAADFEAERLLNGAKAARSMVGQGDTEIRGFMGVKLREIWDRFATGPEDKIEQIAAVDRLAYYTGGKYTALFDDLWVVGPHLNRESTSDQELEATPERTADENVWITIKRPFFKLELSVEDQHGLGVAFFSPDKALAFGPREFARRTAVLNRAWESEYLLYSRQRRHEALIHLLAEADSLIFQPSTQRLRVLNN